MNKDKVFSNLGFCVVVVTIILIAIFHNNISIIGLIGGIGGFLYGICLIVNKNSSGYLFTSLGISLACSFLLYNYKVFDRGDAVTFMICASTFLLMVITLVFMYINNKALFKMYNMQIDAEVVDLIKNPNTTKEYYQIIYQYELDGKVYSVGTPGFVNKNIPNIGDKKKVFVDSTDYANVYFDKSMKEKIYNVGLCAFFMIAALIITITLFF